MSSLSSLSSSSNDPPPAGEIMLFGVRVVVDSMRKSVSLNNLSQYEQPHETANNGVAGAGGGKEGAAGAGGGGAGKDDVAPGYTSENDVVHNSGGNRERERKRGIPWTEEEHKLFLVGLQKVGKGDWRGISRNFVKTRTPTQVASHAQKYFLRRNNHNRRRRRSSLFDITTDSVSAVPMEEEKVNGHHHYQDSASQSHNVPSEPHNARPSCGLSLVPTCPMAVVNPIENLTLGPQNLQINNAPSSNLARPTAIQSFPYGTTMADLSLNLKSTIDASPLTLKLSLPTDPRESSSSSSASSSSRHSAFQSMPAFNNGDKIISVA